MNAIPTISVTLRTVADRQKMHTVRLRITYQRRSIFKSLGIKVEAKCWAEKAEGFKYVLPCDKQHKEKNTIIRREYERLENLFYQQAAHADLNWSVINALVDNNGGNGARFHDVGNNYLASISNAASRKRWSFCHELINGYAPALVVTSIDRQWLAHFEDYLKLRYENVNSRRAPLKYIRAVLNYAIERGMEIEYPFGQGKYKMPAEKKTMRNYLSQDQLASIKKWIRTAPDANCQAAGRWFVFQCYSGLRYSDVEQWTPSRVRGKKIYFSDVKTGTPHFIPIYPELAAALKDIEHLTPFPYERYKRLLRTIGVAVGLQFPLTSHVGRHTFAVHYLEHGGNISVLQSLMGHSDIKTTLVYGKISSRAIEDDMRRVRG